MRFFTHAEREININFTQLQGYIQGTRRELERAFGAPAIIGADGDRTTTHWAIEFADGTVATIYDWKRGTTPTTDEHVSWNIGGMGIAANIKVHNAFREAHGLNARAA